MMTQTLEVERTNQPWTFWAKPQRIASIQVEVEEEVESGLDKMFARNATPGPGRARREGATSRGKRSGPGREITVWIWLICRFGPKSYGGSAHVTPWQLRPPRVPRQRSGSKASSHEGRAPGLPGFVQDRLYLARITGEAKVDDGDLGLAVQRVRIGFDPVPNLMSIKQGSV